jgi:protease-4
MKQFLITIAGVFVGLILFFVVLPVLLIVSAIGAASGGPAIPAQSVLTLDLRRALTDQSSADPFAAFSGSSLSVMKVVTTLHAAEDDDRVKALFVRLPEDGMAPAAAEELRLAIKSFRASGKRVVAHSQGFMPSGVVTSTYMLGAAADELWMQNAASFQVTGISNEEVFLKGLFDRYGVVADFQQRAEYKNAVNPYLYETFTPEHRQATLSWMTSVYDNAIANAALDRKRAPQALRAALESGPLAPSEARAAGLIDQIGQVKAAEDALLKRAGDDAELLEFDDYAEVADTHGDGGPTIAVVEAEGAIITGTGDDQPFGASGMVYSDDVAEALYKAAKDKDVKAVVFRVSSPGGSDVASDQILAAVEAVQRAKKPVVVSMGTYAASGGYWISAKADSIVAQPSTLTGSIGVFGGKIAVGPALERYGVNFESVDVGGTYAGAFNTGEAFNQAQRAEFGQFLDRIYAGFVTLVAEGRDLPVERVQEIARGRVWTGAQARELRLVDETGGFYQAVARAKSLAKIDADAEVALKRFPASKSPFEALGGLFGASAGAVRTLAAAAWLLGDPRAEAVMDRLVEARLREGGATVLESAQVD